MISGEKCAKKNRPFWHVHSNMVARLSMCLSRHLLRKKPERFVGFPNCDSVEAVKKHKDEILEYAYNAALYHDIGKITVLDTIAMYGRKLLDTEFVLLKEHPKKGREIAEDFAKEVEEGAGTRYAPYLAELLKDPDTRADIEFLLNEGRKHLYRETFRLLCDLLRKGQTNAE